MLSLCLSIWITYTPPLHSKTRRLDLSTALRDGDRGRHLEVDPTPIEFNSAGHLNSTFSESYYLGVSTLCLINLQSQ